MATKAWNNITRSVAPKSLFESAKAVISAAVSFNQGDLISLNGGVLTAYTTETTAVNLLGVARQTVVSGVVKSPYSGTAVDASVALEDLVGPVYGVIAKFKVKTSDSLTPGCLLYLAGTDAQTLTVTDPGTHDHMGIYQGAAATAAATERYEVLVGARYGASVAGVTAIVY
jgi:hypothetical protein